MFQQRQGLPDTVRHTQESLDDEQNFHEVGHQVRQDMSETVAKVCVDGGQLPCSSKVERTEECDIVLLASKHHKQDSAYYMDQGDIRSLKRNYRKRHLYAIEKKRDGEDHRS